MHPRIVAASPKPPLVVELTFADGSRGAVDLSRWITESQSVFAGAPRSCGNRSSERGRRRGHRRLAERGRPGPGSTVRAGARRPHAEPKARSSVARNQAG